LIVQGKIKFLPPLPHVLIFTNKNIQKESFKIMVFLAMLATSHYIIEEQFRLRGSTGVVVNIAETRRWIMGKANIFSSTLRTALPPSVFPCPTCKPKLLK